MFDIRYELNAPNVVSEVFDDEYVVLDLSTGTYYSLLDCGNLLWKILLDGVSPAAILDAATRSRNYYGSAIDEFLRRVIELELVRRATPSAPADLSPALADQLTAIDTAPAIEVFDDLADLLLADPVHDVDDQAGWPVIKPA